MADDITPEFTGLVEQFEAVIGERPAEIMTQDWEAGEPGVAVHSLFQALREAGAAIDETQRQSLSAIAAYADPSDYPLIARIAAELGIPMLDELNGVPSTAPPRTPSAAPHRAARPESVWVLPSAIIIIGNYPHDRSTLDAVFGVTDTWIGKLDRAGEQIDVWSYGVPDHARHTLDDTLAAVLAILEPAAATTAPLIGDGMTITVHITGYVGTRSVARFTRDHLRRFAALGVDLALEPSSNER